MLFSQTVYNYLFNHYYHQVSPLEVGGTLSLHVVALKKKSFSRINPFSHRKTESGVVYMTRGGEADQRDAPTVCLILSYVSRLNGSCCYLPHHSFSFLSEGRHAQTQQSLGRTGGSEHGKVTLSLNALTTGQAIYQKFFWGEAMCLIFFFHTLPTQSITGPPTVMRVNRCH